MEQESWARRKARKAAEKKQREKRDKEKLLRKALDARYANSSGSTGCCAESSPETSSASQAAIGRLQAFDFIVAEMLKTLYFYTAKRSTKVTLPGSCLGNGVTLQLLNSRLVRKFGTPRQQLCTAVEQVLELLSAADPRELIRAQLPFPYLTPKLSSGLGVGPIEQKHDGTLELSLPVPEEACWRGFPHPFTGRGLDTGALEKHAFIEYGPSALSRYVPSNDDFGSFGHVRGGDCGFTVAGSCRAQLSSDRYLECVSIHKGDPDPNSTTHNLPLNKQLPPGWQIFHICQSELDKRTDGKRDARLRLAVAHHMYLALRGAMPPPRQRDHLSTRSQVCFLDPISRIAISTWPTDMTLAARIAAEESRTSVAAVRRALSMPALIGATQRVVLSIRRKLKMEKVSTEVGPMLENSVGLGAHKFVNLGTITAPGSSAITELPGWCVQLVRGKQGKFSQSTLRTFDFASWSRWHQLVWPVICELKLARSFTCECNASYSEQSCAKLHITGKCDSGCLFDTDSNTICSKAYPESRMADPAYPGENIMTSNGMKLDELTWQDTLPALNLKHCGCLEHPITCECNIMNWRKVKAYRAAALHIQATDLLLWEQLRAVPPGRCTFDLLAIAAGNAADPPPRSLRFKGHGWVPQPDMSNLASLYDPYDKRMKVDCSLIEALPTLAKSRLPQTLPMSQVDYFDSQPDRMALLRDHNCVYQCEGFVRVSNRAELTIIDDSKFSHWLASTPGEALNLELAAACAELTRVEAKADLHSAQDQFGNVTRTEESLSELGPIQQKAGALRDQFENKRIELTEIDQLEVAIIGQAPAGRTSVSIRKQCARIHDHILQ